MKSIHSLQFDKNTNSKSGYRAPSLRFSTNQPSLLLVLLSAFVVVTPIQCASSFKAKFEYSKNITLDIEGSLKFLPPKKHTLTITISRIWFTNFDVIARSWWIPTEGIESKVKTRSIRWIIHDLNIKQTFQEHPQCLVLMIFLNFRLLTDKDAKDTPKFYLTSPGYGTPIKSDFCLRVCIWPRM